MLFQFFFLFTATTLDDFKQWSLEIHEKNSCYISGVIILHGICVTDMLGMSFSRRINNFIHLTFSCDNVNI